MMAAAQLINKRDNNTPPTTKEKKILLHTQYRKILLYISVTFLNATRQQLIGFKYVYNTITGSKTTYRYTTSH